VYAIFFFLNPKKERKAKNFVKNEILA